jgi:hypothetical protein
VKKRQKKLQWEDVVKRNDIVGGDIEAQEDGDVYRGPISSIELKGGTVIINSPWMAKMEGRSEQWKKWDITRISFDAAMCPPKEIREGRIRFSLLLLGSVVIFPKGGSKLDSSKVEGLEVAQPA